METREWLKFSFEYSNRINRSSVVANRKFPIEHQKQTNKKQWDEEEKMAPEESREYSRLQNVKWTVQCNALLFRFLLILLSSSSIFFCHSTSDWMILFSFSSELN